MLLKILEFSSLVADGFFRLIILRIFSILQRYTLLFLLKIGRFQEQSSKMDGCS